MLLDEALAKSIYFTTVGFNVNAPPVFSALGRSGGMALLVLQLLLLFVAGLATMALSSRLLYALARDHMMPFSHTLRTVWRATGAPVGAVLAVCALDVLICLLPFVSATGYLAVTFTCSIAFFAASFSAG